MAALSAHAALDRNQLRCTNPKHSQLSSAIQFAPQDTERTGVCYFSTSAQRCRHQLLLTPTWCHPQEQPCMSGKAFRTFQHVHLVHSNQVVGITQQRWNSSFTSMWPGCDPMAADTVLKVCTAQYDTPGVSGSSPPGGVLNSLVWLCLVQSHRSLTRQSHCHE